MALPLALSFLARFAALALPGSRLLVDRRGPVLCADLLSFPAQWDRVGIPLSLTVSSSVPSVPSSLSCRIRHAEFSWLSLPLRPSSPRGKAGGPVLTSALPTPISRAVVPQILPKGPAPSRDTAPGPPQAWTQPPPGPPPGRQAARWPPQTPLPHASAPVLRAAVCPLGPPCSREPGPGSQRFALEQFDCLQQPANFQRTSRRHLEIFTEHLLKPVPNRTM